MGELIDVHTKGLLQYAVHFGILFFGKKILQPAAGWYQHTAQVALLLQLSEVRFSGIQVYAPDQLQEVMLTQEYTGILNVHGTEQVRGGSFIWWE